MPVIKPIAIFAAFLSCALAIGCSEPAPATAPPTGVDLVTPFGELDGWAALKARIGEPPESTRLETALDFFRQGLDSLRRDTNPTSRQSAEDMWWAEVERMLTSMLDAERAALVMDWLEMTFDRRFPGGGS